MVRKKAAWHKYLQRMQLIESIPKGTQPCQGLQILSAPGGETTPLPWTYDTWYAPTTPQMVLQAMSPEEGESPTTTMFSGRVANEPARTLVDSGATRKVMDLELC